MRGMIQGPTIHAFRHISLHPGPAVSIHGQSNQIVFKPHAELEYPAPLQQLWLHDDRQDPGEIKGGQ